MTYFSVHDAWADIASGPPRIGFSPGRRPARPVFRLLGIIGAEMTTGDRAAARRFAVRVCASPLAMVRWADELEHLRRRSGADTIPFDLARKPTQRFVHNGLPMMARVQLLKTHYRCLAACFSGALLRSVMAGEETVLWTVSGKSGEVYNLTLCRNTVHKQEGELILRIVKREGASVLGSLSFVAGSVRENDRDDLWIGGLQGCKALESKQSIVSATKDLWGMRPKNLLIHAVYALADAMDVRAIRAISNLRHVHRRPRMEKVWSADYDQFWSELGGHLSADGFYVLPRSQPCRSLDAVPASKRRAWSTRQTLIASMRTSVSDLCARRGAASSGASRPGAFGAP